jgi:predicted TIM-barrel enzyme
MSTTILTRIEDLKAQIASLEKNALQELMEKRNTLSHELAAVDAEIAKLTGKPVEGKKARAVVAKATGKSPSLQELKEILAAAPGKTIGVRAEGYDLRNIKVLAKANPQLLSVGGKGAWPTVTLLK